MIDLKRYLSEYRETIFSDENLDKLHLLGEILADHRKRDKSVIIFGNGASASIASHFALDMTKQGQLKTQCFHDPALLTAYANDYGYENCFKEMVRSYSTEDQIAIFVSTSGESENVVRAQQQAKERGLITVSFTGRQKDNRLARGSDISFWVDSHAYNIVENTHSIWLMSLVDYLVGTAVYEVS